MSSILPTQSKWPSAGSQTSSEGSGGVAVVSTGMKILPSQVWPVTPRETLNDSAVSAQATQLTVAAENAPLRVIYGTPRLGPQIADAVFHGANLVMLCVWGHGPVDSVSNLLIDDAAPVAGVTYSHYTGAAGQGVDGTLFSAFAAQSPSIAYTDTLEGVCYSVVSVPAGASKGFPRITVDVKGLKVYDPRKDSTNGGSGAHRLATPTTWEWSDNPVLCTANFISSPVYGMKRIVDWTSVISSANDNDTLYGTYPNQEKARTLNLALETVQNVSSWLDTLRAYTGCWAGPSPSGYKFVSDKVGTPVASYSHVAGNIRTLGAIEKRGVQNTPTVLILTYTDTRTPPYRDGTVTVYAPGVLAGSTPRRESSVSMPGLNRHSQAYREATERLNKLLLNDLSMSIGVYDGYHEIGDIVTVTYPHFGLTAKPMRVMATSGEYGLQDLNLGEYDPLAYCEEVVSTPTYADTTSPSPSAPPAVTGVTMSEEVFQQRNGTWTSRWRVTWTAASYTFLDKYRAELWQGTTLVHAGSPTSAEWPTPAVQEGLVYTAKVAAVSTLGTLGDWGTQSASALGKSLLPGNVPGVTAFEASGRVYVNWQPAVDIDIWQYEVRYGPVGTPWASTTLIDRTDALRLTSDQIPVGTWTLHVKALDSVRQYSPAAATCNVIVTSDASAFLVSTFNFTAPTPTNMAEYRLARADTNRYFVTEDAALWNTKFSANLNTYTNVLATYHGSVTSTWLSDVADFMLDLGGQWTGTATVADLSGSHISYFGGAMAATPSTWVYTAGLSQKTNARFARLKHESLTTSTMLVTIPTQQIRLDAIPREEVGTGTSLSTGPLTITLVNAYVAVKKLTITPLGTTGRSAVADNITFVGSVAKFDVYVFDSTGVKIASPFRYEWQGV